jgi:aspartyl-tRNA(Asn)/glutamyl-tRNA(Gln) amidotransferase subunit B
VSTDTWETVIGLEVHCELATRTKLFCGCRNAFGDEPNTNVCPVCLGLPGSLPVLNEYAVELAMRIGAALHCEIRASSFARKNYFYPDQAKDYQISQYDEPINVAGRLDLPGGSRVGVTRAHLEEDTGKLTHVGDGGRIGSARHALVDYNRSGVPLVEIVSEPDIRSAAQAREYASELRGILVATGASDGLLEEGSMRFDANVSVRPLGTHEFGTRCEIKNLNSLRSLGRAIDYEAARQMALIAAGEPVQQETRHWDEAAGRTESMRSKEEANDYRYFPEPDLVPLAPDAAWQELVRASLGPMPADRRAELVKLLGDSPTAAAADQIRAVVDLGLDPLVRAAVTAGAPPALALARAANELAAEGEAGLLLARAADELNPFTTIVLMESGGTLSPTQSKAVLSASVQAISADVKSGASVTAAVTRSDPAALAKEMGFEALGADTLAAIVAEVIAKNPEEWARLVEGDDVTKKKLRGFFTGEVMRATAGKANGSEVVAELGRRLAAH